MRSAKHLRLVAFIVFLIMALVAALPFWLNRSAGMMLGAARVEAQRQQRLDDILASVRDAETAQRGFIITGKDVFLDPYRQAQRVLPGMLHAAKDGAGTDAERAVAWRIARLAELKMAELDETIALRRSAGFEPAERIVSALRGQLLMDELRQLVGTESARSKERRNALRVAFLAQSTRSFYAGLAATAINVLALGILLLLVMRMLRQRRALATQLQQQAGELSAAVALASRHNRELRLVAEMLRAVEAVPTSVEAAAAIARFVPRLLPGAAGTLFLLRDDDGMLARQAQWGEASAQPAEMDLDACWALRHNARYRTGSYDDPACAHYRKPADEAAARLCVPLVTHDELVGMLHLEGLANDGAAQQDEQERLAVTVGEQIALALGNARLRESLRRQSVLDPLTGLFNRRHFDAALKRELARARRKGVPVALVVVDIDHFKRVNDGYGHAVGDAVLRTVAQQVRLGIREGDIACRYGGEEMVILLPECTAATALARAEAIRLAIAAVVPNPEGEGPERMTASFGVAEYPGHAHDAESLFWSADKALYRAKQQGRNRVVLGM